MKKRVPLLLLILTTGWFSPSIARTAYAADMETRKIEITPPPKSDGEFVRLGSVSLPSEVVRKLDAEQIADILERQVPKPPKTTAELIFNEGLLVPGVVFASLTCISFLLIYFSFRKRREMLDTVRVAIQSGQTLPASFLEALESSRSKPTPDGDLRKAVLLLALGISGAVVLASLGDKEIGRVWSIGLLPTLLGVGYLFLWRQSQKRIKNGSADDQR